MFYHGTFHSSPAAAVFGYAAPDGAGDPRLSREPDLPLFIVEGENIVEPIPSLDGQWRYSPDRVCEAVEACRKAGVNKVLLFGIPAHKDACGSEAWNPDGVVQQGIRAIKATYPDCYVITDVCMCEYTDHGHCGILCGHTVDNDKTLEVLSKTALSHVQAEPIWWLLRI